MKEFARRYRWELFIVAMLAIAVIWSSGLSPFYLAAQQLLYSSRNFVFTGIMAMGLMMIIVTGEMDLSLPSILAVCTVALAKFSSWSIPLALALPAIVGVGALLGFLNGVLVTRLKLPSLAVTLGTMGAYRGLAFIIGSEVGYTSFNGQYLWLGASNIGKSAIPVMLIVYVVCAAAFVLLAHFTTFGRRCFAVGNNAPAVRYSGGNVELIKTAAYVIGGITAALGAWVFIGQFGSARGDNANGVILGVITAVVLGGVDINGGKGTVGGVLLSILFLWTLRNGMGLANIAGPVEQLIIGVFLVTSVIISNLPEMDVVRRIRVRRERVVSAPDKLR
ncbi:MAG TPA: ABC transporter permease [Spirochaetia bacterium]|nr:ABC transporter permease [Spirochaetia bacterium]